MPNLIPQDIREWMRRMEFKTNDLTRRLGSLIPGDIADSVDLDGFTSSGRWRRQSVTGTTTALKYPFDGAAGTLEVYWDPTFNQVHQVFYDRAGSIWTRWFNGATWSAWVAADASGFPITSGATAAGSQIIVATTNFATMPTTPVTAGLALPAGRHEVLAAISGLIGNGTSGTITSSVSLAYHLSGALTFAPVLGTAAVSGTNACIGSGGGTLARVHTVTLAAPATLTITAMAALHFGTAVTIRDVGVRLTAVRRS